MCTWQLDEHKNALEAHVVIADVHQIEPVKSRLKNVLARDYAIDHSTLEFEVSHCGECEDGC